jgi:glyoxylase-like metal-dependent hydrolase (beta-lactamase superfamily II)
MLKVIRFEFNYFGENTYLLIDEDTNQAIVVDPGMFKPKEQNVFDKYIQANNIKLTLIVNTHLHLDHIFSDNYVHNKYGIKIAAHKDDASLGMSIVSQAQRFGLSIEESPVKIDQELNDGDTIDVGNNRITILHVPGHSLGGIALYCKADGFILSGDSLFSHSIGRTDLPGGNAQQLINSIKEKLLTLPEQTTVMPGHGPYTTISIERSENPYI